MSGVNAWLLTRMAHDVNRRIDTALAHSGLSADRWRVLDFLSAYGPCTMTSLADATSINGATLTRLTDRLVARALVYRSADSQDRRRVLVHLSERGRALIHELEPVVRAAEAEAAARLTEAEREDLMQLLQRMGPALTRS